MESSRSQLIQFITQGAIPTDKIPAALTTLNIIPDGTAWRKFIDQILLWMGGLALAFAILFFIAYNWTAIGHFAKFGIIEVALVLTIMGYWKLGTDKVAGKVALLMATMFMGVLLALYGQTYQTGADPWQLFLNWALLVLPWALIGQFPALWIVWIGLINLSLVLYVQTFHGLLGMAFTAEVRLLMDPLCFQYTCPTYLGGSSQNSDLVSRTMGSPTFSSGWRCLIDGVSPACNF